MSRGVGIHVDEIASRATRLRTVSRALAWSSFGLGCAVLLGWIFGVGWLIAVPAGGVPMKPISALAFVVLGLSLRLQGRGPPRRRRFGRALAVATAAVSAATLASYAAVPPIGEALQHRMSPHTALAFVLAAGGIALLPSQAPRGRRAAEVLAALTALAAWIGVLGHAYGAPPLYGLSRTLGMGVHTALGLLLLAGGMLLAEPDRGWMAVLTGETKGGFVARRLLPVSLAAPFLLGLALIVEQHRARRPDFALGSAVLVALCTVGLAAMVVLTASVLRRQEEATAAAEQRLHAVTNNAALGLFMMDARQHCTFMNPAAEEMTGFRIAEVQGKPLHEFVHHTRPDGTPYPMEECPIDRALPERNRQRGEDVFVRPDGSFYPVAFTASPIIESGSPVGTVIEVRDTTDEKRAEQEHEQLLTELRQAVAARDEFLSIAAHELRTPLTSLVLVLATASKLLQRDGGAATGPATFEKVRAALRQTDRLTGLINALLDVSRIATGRFTLERETFDLVELVAEVVDRTAELARRAGSSVTFHALGPVPGRWDRTKLDQVLTNLVMNALKYGPGKPVDITVAATEREVAFTVADQGIGIAEADLGRIFERFERAVPSRHYGGLGLGLYVARQIVDAHGGVLHVESEPGKGAAFCATLPRDLEEPTSQAPARAVG